MLKRTKLFAEEEREANELDLSCFKIYFQNGHSKIHREPCSDTVFIFQQNKFFTKLPLGYDILHCHKDFVENFMKIFFDGFYESFQFLKLIHTEYKVITTCRYTSR